MKWWDQMPWSSFSECCVQLFETPWTVAYQAPPPMEFSRPEYWSGLSFPSPGDFPTQRSNLGLLHCRQILYHLSHQRSPYLQIKIPGNCNVQPRFHWSNSTFRDTAIISSFTAVPRDRYWQPQVSLSLQTPSQALFTSWWTIQLPKCLIISLIRNNPNFLKICFWLC